MELNSALARKIYFELDDKSGLPVMCYKSKFEIKAYVLIGKRSPYSYQTKFTNGSIIVVSNYETFEQVLLEFEKQFHNNTHKKQGEKDSPEVERTKEILDIITTMRQIDSLEWIEEEIKQRYGL